MYCPYCGSELPRDAVYCPACGRPQQVPVSPQVTDSVAAYSAAPLGEMKPAPVYAGFWVRFVAFLIDTLILFVIGIVISILFGAGAHSRLLGLLIGWMYFAVMESSPAQATFGKQVLGLVVTDINGQQLTFGRATGRYFAKLLSGLTLLIGYIMAGFTAKKQALHDMIAGTLVIRAQARASERPPAAASF